MQFSCGRDGCVPVDTHCFQLAQRFLLPEAQGKPLSARLYSKIVDRFHEVFGAQFAGWAFMTLFAGELADFRRRLIWQSAPCPKPDTPKSSDHAAGPTQSQIKKPAAKKSAAKIPEKSTAKKSAAKIKKSEYWDQPATLLPTSRDQGRDTYLIRDTPIAGSPDAYPDDIIPALTPPPTRRPIRRRCEMACEKVIPEDAGIPEDVGAEVEEARARKRHRSLGGGCAASVTASVAAGGDLTQRDLMRQPVGCKSTGRSRSDLLASPNMASPNMASPNMASPNMASPNMASPYMASPNMASPYMASTRPSSWRTNQPMTPPTQTKTATHHTAASQPANGHAILGHDPPAILGHSPPAILGHGPPAILRHGPPRCSARLLGRGQADARKGDMAGKGGGEFA